MKANETALPKVIDLLTEGRSQSDRIKGVSSQAETTRMAMSPTASRKLIY